MNCPLMEIFGRVEAQKDLTIVSVAVERKGVELFLYMSLREPTDVVEAEFVEPLFKLTPVDIHDKSTLGGKSRLCLVARSAFSAISGGIRGGG